MNIKNNLKTCVICKKEIAHNQNGIFWNCKWVCSYECLDILQGYAQEFKITTLKSILKGLY